PTTSPTTLRNTPSLHDALPILTANSISITPASSSDWDAGTKPDLTTKQRRVSCRIRPKRITIMHCSLPQEEKEMMQSRSYSGRLDRKSTRLNSSHQIISYAVFC